MDDCGNNRIQMTTRSASDEGVIMELGLVEFLTGLQNSVSNYMEKVPLRTTHTRHGTIFRGSPKFIGEVWRDWVMVDWGRSGKLPCKIYGFVDLSALPLNNRVSYGGLPNISPGQYAIVESASYVDDEDQENMSELLTPIEKEVGEITNDQVSQLKLYLAPVEAFLDPLVVIPDMGGEPNAYFVLKSRPKWRESFIKWLEAKHSHDVIDVSDEEDSEEEDVIDVSDEEDSEEEDVMEDSDEEDSEEEDVMEDSDEEDSEEDDVIEDSDEEDSEEEDVIEDSDEDDSEEE